VGCELGEGYPFKTQEQIDLAKKMRITEMVGLRNFWSALAGCASWRGFRPCVLAPHDCLGPIAITPTPMLCPASRFSKRSKNAKTRSDPEASGATVRGLEQFWLYARCEAPDVRRLLALCNDENVVGDIA
jgi:hypothetical protein